MADLIDALYKKFTDEYPGFSVDVFSNGENYHIHMVAMWADNIVPDSLQSLSTFLRRAWTLDSSTATEWDATRPETGQCAVTALIVQDHSGGDLLRAIVNGESHYWNRLPDGTEADLTRRQFDRYPDIGEVVVRDRQLVLSNPDTAERYAALRQNMERLG